MKDVKVDWSKAPEGATDFNRVNNMWYKEDAEGMMSWWYSSGQYWSEGDYRSNYDIGGETTFISRPKEVKSMIGIKSGKDWSQAPKDATHVAKNIKGNFSHFYKYENGEWCFAKDKYDSYLTSANSLSDWFNPISKEDDLQLKTKPKYSSLQELPVGTFVKWTGDDYYQIYVKSKVDTEKCMVILENFAPHSGLGFNVSCDNFYLPRCTYSDKYDGEYIPFVEEQTAQVVPQAIKDGWKIKHIKSPNYKCGRDVAVTILYREVSLTSYQYKFAICNVTDMFCRKKGVEVANNKKEVFLIKSHPNKLFNNILQDIDSYNGGSVQFKELKRYYQLNH